MYTIKTNFVHFFKNIIRKFRIMMLLTRNFDWLLHSPKKIPFLPLFYASKTNHIDINIS